MADKIAISNDTILNPGDVVELNFSLAGPSWLWLKATESDMIENRLKAKYPNFEIQSYEWAPDYSTLTITVKVINPTTQDSTTESAGMEITAAFICAAIITASLVYWFTQGTTYKIVQTAAPAISLLAVAAILFFVYKLFGKGAFTK